MKNRSRRPLSLLLAFLLTLTLAPSSAYAEDGGENAYSDASVQDIRVKATAVDGHIRFDEKDDVQTLEYRGDSNEFQSVTVLSVEDALNDVCLQYFKKDVDSSHKDYTFDYISYVSLSATQGTIYNGYNTEGDTGSGVAGVLKYYYRTSGASSNNRIGDIRFVPKSSFSGEALISYYGYYHYSEKKNDAGGEWVRKDGSYAGRIYISVGKQEPGISYATDGEPVRFAADDFTTYSLAVTGRAFRYVTFVTPTSEKGALYLNYLDKDIYDSQIQTGDRYYRSTTPSVDDVYFVPKKGYSGKFELSFTYVDLAGETRSGEVNITVTDYGPGYTKETASGPFHYAVKKGRSVTLKADDFKDKCKAETGSTFSSVRFSALPSHGTLYDGSGSKDNYVAVNKTYASPGNIRYVADSNYVGTLTVPYVCYATSGKWFDGTLTIVVSEDDSQPLRYTVDPGKRVFFLVDDFSDACYAATGYDISRIRFGSLPSASYGTLYSDGNPISKTGTDYYKSSLGNLSFLAAGDFNSAVSIPFTGYGYGYLSSNSRSFSGNIIIASTTTVEQKEEAGIGSSTKTLFYYTSGPAVRLRKDDILNIASPVLGVAPETIFLSRPADEEGTLRFDFYSLSRNDDYDPRSPHTPDDLDHVSFLPKAGFGGSARISYTARDKSGNSFTGNIVFVVTPPTRSSYFNDMSSHGWAIQAVDFFRYYSVTNGTSVTSFTPNADMRRGDFILLLSRAFSFPNYGAVESFSDVPLDKYYAAAIASAKKLGVITEAELKEDAKKAEKAEEAAEAGVTFRPEEPITREDAGLYLYRALRRGGEIEAGGSAYLARFPDKADISSRAVAAMDALVREDVFRGYGSLLAPKQLLTRAETMTILYRALT